MNRKNAVLMALFAAFAGCTGAPLVSEGELELDYDTDSVQPGGACLVDSDCDGELECLRGFCFAPTSYCVDDTHALRSLMLDELSDATIVDCSVWGGWCEDRRGCVLPAGSECVAWSTCGVDGGSWACPAHRVCDDPPANISSPAFPQRVTLPATVTFDAGEVQCVVVELDAPAGIVSDDDLSQLFILQGDDRRRGFSGGLQAAAGQLLICGRTTANTVSLDLVAFDDERLGDICLDTTHKRVNNEIVACDEGTTCSTRLVPFPVCRGGVGDACFGSSCIGSCLTDGDTSVCTADRLNPDNGGLCSDGILQDGNLLPVERFVCSERCEDLVGCVVEPSHACFAYERCIDPTTHDKVFGCPDAGVCPE